ncbi:MAG: universal stress protein [Jiangellales bacterium]
MSVIVVGVDGSEQSRRALVWAFTNAEPMRAAVQAVMVVDTTGMDEVTREMRLHQAERTVADLVDEVSDVYPQPQAVTCEVREGDPIAVMLDATRRADLMVFGARRMSSIRNPALGTVSLACTRHGCCPVLVVPEGLHDAAPRADLVPA